MNTMEEAKYNMMVNPVYQVDFQKRSSGKRISLTKRRVSWKFGFSNKDAVSQGLTGTECRGEEHEILLVWSHSSGKRMVTADGEEVHVSYGKCTDTRFETSWTMRGGHIIKLVAHATSPLFPKPEFKQFDLFLDGCSYFEMPRIFELGTEDASKLAIADAPTVTETDYTVSSGSRRSYSEDSTTSSLSMSMHSLPLESNTRGDFGEYSPASSGSRFYNSMPGVMENTTLLITHDYCADNDSITNASSELHYAQSPTRSTSEPAIQYNAMTVAAPTNTYYPDASAAAWQQQPQAWQEAPQFAEQQTTQPAFQQQSHDLVAYQGGAMAPSLNGFAAGAHPSHYPVYMPQQQLQ